MAEGGNGVDEKEYVQTIADIREWLVRIDTNQTHQTKLLETINDQASNAFTKADSAEDKAEQALKVSAQNKHDFEKYVDEEKKGRRWLIGIMITVAIALLPIFDKFYL